MNSGLQLPNPTDLRPRITVIGVGGAGGNTINNMIASGLSGVQFVVANTDAQALATSSAGQRIQLGAHLTEGLGAGSKPEIGQAAAEEAIDEIRTRLAGSHMIFIAAGMGGGTGTGAGPVIARVARELGALTVAVVTKPFQFEGSRRMRVAEAGIAELKKHVDTLIIIPNQNLFGIVNDKTTFAEAFVFADQVLYSGIACIVDVIVKEGLINLDLADVRTVLSGMSTAMIGAGEASGERRAVLAAEQAISNPLLDDVSLKGAKGLLLTILGGRDLTLYEVDEVARRVRREVDPDANIIVGATFDESLAGRVRVSIVASGMSRAADSPVNAPGLAHPHAATPVALAQTGPAIRQTDSVTVALSRAIQQGTWSSPMRDGRRSRGTWRGPGNVVVEEVSPQFGQDAALELLARRSSSGSERGGEVFSSATPAADQREHQPPAGEPASQIAGATPRGLAPESERLRKRGLFMRLTDLGRRGDGNAPANRASSPPAAAAASEPALPTAECGWPNGSLAAPVRLAEDAELPRFFTMKPKAADAT
jgi:cell division protein FtsZ